MNELQIFNNDAFGELRTIETDGGVLFCGTDIAGALGYSNTKDAIIRHCRGVVKRDLIDSLGRAQEASFILEGDVYRLIVRSKLPAAEQFERWVFDEVLPELRRHGAYATRKLSSTDLLELQVKALRSIEQKQMEQAVAIAATNARLDAIKDTIQLNPASWREDSRRIIVQIAQKLGGNEHIRVVTSELYEMVDARAGVSLAKRLTNKRQRMALEGVCKSKRDRLTRMDIIAEDKKLIEISAAIIKEMAIKYLDNDAA